jgi:predicted ester cyclase
MLMVSPLDERELARRRAPVSAEKNKTLVRKFFEETWSKGNVAAVDEFTATNYLEHGLPSGLLPGPEGLKRLSAAYRSAFPDLNVTLDDIFAVGDRLTIRWSARGTHLDDWLGIPPTGNHVRATGITIYRVAGGRWWRAGPAST